VGIVNFTADTLIPEISLDVLLPKNNLCATTRDSMNHQIYHLGCQSVHAAKMMQTGACSAALDGCGGRKGMGYDASSMDASRPSWSKKGLSFLGPLPVSGACS